MVASTPVLRVLSIGGTRPEAIKLAPIALAAAGRAVAHRLVATGQHHLFGEVLADFGLTPDRDLALGAPGLDPAILERRIDAALPALIAAERPDLILVQGDTTSAWVAARAAHRLGVAVGHVEAGLRSHDPALPWPEERNRVEIDALATLCFAPTAGAAANLAAEPAVTGAVVVTGNTGIDALLHVRAGLGLRAPASRRLIVVTCHRREAIGGGIARIGAAVRALAARGDVRIVLPVHPNPLVAAGVRAALDGVANVELTTPLGYAAFVRLLDAAHLLLTDSGGLQEEAPALGLPTLVLRDLTERPEALATGNLRLVGTDPEAIVAAASALLDDPRAHAAMAAPAFPYGDGRAAPRIWDAIEAWAAARPSQPIARFA